jgi:hypothetical protein
MSAKIRSAVVMCGDHGLEFGVRPPLGGQLLLDELPHPEHRDRCQQQLEEEVPPVAWPLLVVVAVVVFHVRTFSSP